MAEYIDRLDAYLAIGEKVKEGRNAVNEGLAAAIDAIGAMPAADVAPVRHGEWFVSIGKDGKPVGTICTICGFAWSEAIDAIKLEPCLSFIKTAYCPNCGTKTDGGVDDA